MKSILLYGDSLVYGKIPKLSKRYPREKNFIGVLERELGSDYQIIDEGLRARTLSGENGFFPERNGLEQFGPIIGSHLPLDLTCIFLGTNDCNKKDLKTEGELAQSILDYKNKIIEWCKNLSVENIPKLLIISPPIIRADQLVLNEAMSNIFGSDAEEKSKKLKTIYEDFCQKENCLFFDAAEYCTATDGEGIHLNEENNVLLGKALVDKIKTIL